MIIGICGFQSSGKDTIAEYLIKEHGYVKYSFASVLKDIVSIMFGWSRDKLEGITIEDREWRENIDPWWSRKLKIPELSPRYVMQYFATDLFRNKFHPDIWVNILENKLIELNYLNKNIVISDCRFNNEVDMILRLGGVSIHVYRDLPNWFYEYREGKNPDFDKYYKKYDRKYKYEIEWIRSWRDYEIENNGTIEELYDKVKLMLAKLKK